MLGPGRYLLGTAELATVVAFAGLGAARMRARLLPELEGAPAHLAVALLGLALSLWVAELLGTVGLLRPAPYILGTAAVGSGIWALGRGWGEGGEASRGAEPAQGKASSLQAKTPRRPKQGAGQVRPLSPHERTRGRGADIATWISLAAAALAVIHFAGGVRLRLSTGMTGFDSTWYHGPFAAGFFQSGDTWSLHFIAPQFLAWLYPANSEIFHAVGMAAFGRDILSPLLNLGWFVGCLGAAWCIGRPYRVAPFSLGLAAVAMSVPVLADQAGEARNDIVGIFFLLAAVAVALNAWEARSERGLSTGAVAVVGLAVGLAAGTKLNFLLPAGVVVLGLAVIAPSGARWRAFWVSGLAALGGGGYWYLRNLAHTGNPLPWIHHLGPISLPSPEQGLGGREAHSVLSYLTDGSVWSGWFLPGLHHGLWLVWPLLAAMALAGLLLCLAPLVVSLRCSFSGNDAEKEQRKRTGGEPVLCVAGLAGLALALAWLIAPTSASGPDGVPRGFESGLRYLAPALVLGLALLPATPLLRARLDHLAVLRSHFFPDSGENYDRSAGLGASRWRLGAGAASAPMRVSVAIGTALVLVAVAVGYPIQRHYLRDRYANPSFTTGGLNAAFAWARGVSGARIATTSTRQYPLFGTDLSNRVDFVGEELPHGGFEAPATCRAWRQALNEGDYDYVVASRDRMESGKPPYPPTARWTEGPGTRTVLRIPPTVVFELGRPLDPSTCPG